MINIEVGSLFNLLERFQNEQDCRDYLEQIRWNGKPKCPHCSHDSVYKFKDGKLWKCAKCRKQFTVKVGTIFEESNISLRKWFTAIYIISAHKKGISSLQLSKDIKVTQKTAWFMNHRIRYAMTSKSFLMGLNNIVEADETYIGGLSKNKHRSKRLKGTGTANKTPIFGMVERKGEVRAVPVIKADTNTLTDIIRKNLDKRAVLMTDDHGAYRKIHREFEHLVVNHTEGEYGVGMIHTNTIEGFWSLLKRGIIGIYHQVSPKHLHRYCDEFSFRYNIRESSDGVKFIHTLNRAKGKRLKYQTLINTNPL